MKKNEFLILAVLALVMQGVVSNNVWADGDDPVPEGNVSIENGNKLNIDKSGGVIIKNGFKCKLGGTLKIE
ncbi:MAG: hypothetical protein IJR87_05965 [Bacteroidaceae bacterium]|nr:hypothetical protein [Bacteroidaceae bacterium]